MNVSECWVATSDSEANGYTPLNSSVDTGTGVEGMRCCCVVPIVWSICVFKLLLDMATNIVISPLVDVLTVCRLV